MQGTKEAEPNEAHRIAWGVIGVQGGKGAEPNEGSRIAWGVREMQGAKGADHRIAWGSWG
jgi:hypothetical protein